MAYVTSHGALGVTKDQQETLVDIPEADLRKLPTEERLNLVLRRQEVKAAESSARWDALATFTTVAIPIAAFFGISWVTKGKL